MLSPIGFEATSYRETRRSEEEGLYKELYSHPIKHSRLELLSKCLQTVPTELQKIYYDFCVLYVVMTQVFIRKFCHEIGHRPHISTSISRKAFMLGSYLFATAVLEFTPCQNKLQRNKEHVDILLKGVRSKLFSMASTQIIRNGEL